jgi:hypothetical protein
VALANDEKTVIGSGKTLKEAILRAKEKGNKSPILTKMPENLVPYVGAL